MTGLLSVRFRESANRVAVGAGLLCAMLASFVALGCACTEQIEVHNRTERSLYVQLAYPWPSYAVAPKRGCHFALALDSGEVWRAGEATPEQKASLALAQPNGPLLLRVRRAGGEWVLFALMIDRPLESIDPVHLCVSRSGSDGLDAEAMGGMGQVLALELVDDALWFPDKNP